MTRQAAAADNVDNHQNPEFDISELSFSFPFLSFLDYKFLGENPIVYIEKAILGFDITIESSDVKAQDKYLAKSLKLFFAEIGLAISSEVGASFTLQKEQKIQIKRNHKEYYEKYLQLSAKTNFEIDQEINSNPDFEKFYQEKFGKTELKGYGKKIMLHRIAQAFSLSDPGGKNVKSDQTKINQTLDFCEKNNLYSEVAKINLAKGDYYWAEKMADFAITNSGSSKKDVLKAKQVKAECLKRKREYNEAYVLYNEIYQATNFFPNAISSFEMLKMLGDATEMARYLDAIIVQLNNDEECKKIKFSSSSTPESQKAEIFYERAKLFEQEQKFEQAFSFFKLAVKFNKNAKLEFFKYSIYGIGCDQNDHAINLFNLFERTETAPHHKICELLSSSSDMQDENFAAKLQGLSNEAGKNIYLAIKILELSAQIYEFGVKKKQDDAAYFQEPNFAKALENYKIIATFSNSKAAKRLALAYKNGELGLQKNDSLALSYFFKAIYYARQEGEVEDLIASLKNDILEIIKQDNSLIAPYYDDSNPSKKYLPQEFSFETNYFYAQYLQDINSENIDEIIKLYKNAAGDSDRPRCQFAPQCYYELAEIYYAKSDFKKSQEYFDKAILLDKNYRDHPFAIVLNRAFDLAKRQEIATKIARRALTGSVAQYVLENAPPVVDSGPQILFEKPKTNSRGGRSRHRAGALGKKVAERAEPVDFPGVVNPVNIAPQLSPPNLQKRGGGARRVGRPYDHKKIMLAAQKNAANFSGLASRVAEFEKKTADNQHENKPAQPTRQNQSRSQQQRPQRQPQPQAAQQNRTLARPNQNQQQLYSPQNLQQAAQQDHLRYNISHANKYGDILSKYRVIEQLYRSGLKRDAIWHVQDLLSRPFNTYRLSHEHLAAFANLLAEIFQEKIFSQDANSNFKPEFEDVLMIYYALNFLGYVRQNLSYNIPIYQQNTPIIFNQALFSLQSLLQQAQNRHLPYYHWNYNPPKNVVEKIEAVKMFSNSGFIDDVLWYIDNLSNCENRHDKDYYAGLTYENFVDFSGFVAQFFARKIKDDLDSFQKLKFNEAIMSNFLDFFEDCDKNYFVGVVKNEKDVAACNEAKIELKQTLSFVVEQLNLSKKLNAIPENQNSFQHQINLANKGIAASQYYCFLAYRNGIDSQGFRLEKDQDLSLKYLKEFVENEDFKDSEIYKKVLRFYGNLVTPQNSPQNLNPNATSQLSAEAPQRAV